MKNIQIIHRREILMLKEFIRICDKHNLIYYMLGGTLLGAVRHKGFIPWDDDIDIGMPRNDFEKFKSIVKQEVTYPFYCENDNDISSYKLAFMKFCDSETQVYWEHNNEKIVVDLWMDIFPIDGMPGNILKRKIHEYRYLYSRMMANLAQFSNIVNLNKKNRPFYESLIINIARKLNLEKLLNYNKWQKKYIEVISKYSTSEKYAGNYTGAYKLREVVPSDYFGKGEKLDFEGLKVNAPSKYKEYLTAIYGNNFMQLPPIEARQAHGLEIVK